MDFWLVRFLLFIGFVFFVFFRSFSIILNSILYFCLIVCVHIAACMHTTSPPYKHINIRTYVQKSVGMCVHLPVCFLVCLLFVFTCRDLSNEYPRKSSPPPSPHISQPGPSWRKVFKCELQCLCRWLVGWLACWLGYLPTGPSWPGRRQCFVINIFAVCPQLLTST